MVLYEMVAGRPVLYGDDPVAIAYQHVRENLVHCGGYDDQVPKELEAITGKLLQDGPHPPVPVRRGLGPISGASARA